MSPLLALVTLLAAALPVLGLWPAPTATAACPCVVVPATARVCGTDGRTYDSSCHLECVATPGLSEVHPGPCSTLDAALQPSASSELHRRSRHSAAEQKRKGMECIMQQQCAGVTCECVRGDMRCEFMCVRNCECGCWGHPAAGMDKGLWGQCTSERDCGSKHAACEVGCDTGECKDQCWMDYWKCDCGCVAQAGRRFSAANGTSTTPGGTTAGTGSTAASRTAPSSASRPLASSPAPPTPGVTVAPEQPPGSGVAVHLVWGSVVMFACGCVLAGLCVLARSRAPVTCCSMGFGGRLPCSSQPPGSASTTNGTGRDDVELTAHAKHAA